MDIKQIQNIYFIGIGGIGMSALARYFKNLGKNVAGYDRHPTPITKSLEDLGIEIHFDDDITKIPTTYGVETTLIVITPAVPKTHSEWNYFVERNYSIKKRAEVLGIITRNTFCFAVAGTHGKTTTSAILGHILYESGVDVTAFVGGVVENYNSNLIGLGKTVTVVEADEFDRSFLQLHPDIACITSMDADHLDIYGDSAAIEATFCEFADKITDKSNLFIADGLPLKGKTVAVNHDADCKAFNVKIEDGSYVFDVKIGDNILTSMKFALPGRHNLMNATMALSMAYKYGISEEQIAAALKSFRGIQRRFSCQIQRDDLVYIDDYAHHPTEINAVHQAVRELFPNDQVVAIFQPHLFSRTRDFATDFASSLSQFDKILLMDIYPARELPMPGITSQWLLDQISNENKKLVLKEDLIQEIKAANCKIIVTIGAGDIGEMVAPIKEALS